MIFHGKITREFLEPKEVTCDICGANCWKDPNFEYLSCKVCWGYGSNHDEEEIDWQICEECVYSKIVPMIKKSRLSNSVGEGL